MSTGYPGLETGEDTMNELEAVAKEIAAELGRDWEDCGAYERLSFLEEAARRVYGDE